MKERIINDVLRIMQGTLNNAQLLQLQETLKLLFVAVSVVPAREGPDQSGPDNTKLLSMFLDAKRVEGCSEKTLRYYESTLKKMFEELNMPMVHVRTEVLRDYLSDYRKKTGCSKSSG